MQFQPIERWMNNKDNFLKFFVPKIFQPLPSLGGTKHTTYPLQTAFALFLKIMLFPNFPNFVGSVFVVWGIPSLPPQQKPSITATASGCPRAFQKHLGFHRYFPLSNGLSVPANDEFGNGRQQKMVVSAFCFSFPDGNPGLSENPKLEFMASWNLNTIRNMMKNTASIIESDGLVSDWIPIGFWRGWKTHWIQKAARCLFFGVMLHFDTKKHQGILKHSLNKTSHVFHYKVGPRKPVISKSYKPSNQCIRAFIRL